MLEEGKKQYISSREIPNVTSSLQLRTILKSSLNFKDSEQNPVKYCDFVAYTD